MRRWFPRLIIAAGQFVEGARLERDGIVDRIVARSAAGALTSDFSG
jgi:hypothetical protein